MADEREERQARELQTRMLAELRDLRGDCDYRIGAIIGNQDNRTPDDLSEQRREQEWVRGELAALQRRIDQTISSLR